MTTRRQHYVWRHYLEGWQDSNNLVHSMRQGALLPPSNPLNLAVQRDFYKIPTLNESQKKYLYHFAEQSSPHLTQVHRDFIDKLIYISNANQQIQQSESISDEEKAVAQAIVIETEEQLHSQIEELALPLLDHLRLKQVDFIDDDTDAIDLFHFLGQQYFRTKHIREAITAELSKANTADELTPLSGVICHMAGVNFGGSLFSDRGNLDVVILSRGEGVEFITGDQPIVNLLAGEDGRETTELTLYYPLSPQLACVAAPKEYRCLPGPLDDSTTALLNIEIARASDEFWIASSDAILTDILEQVATAGPRDRRILDLLAGPR